MNINWVNEFPCAITVCNTRGEIVYFNEKSALTFEKYGGKEMLGKSLFDCHGKVSSDKIREMLHTQEVNVYTIEKNGVKKLIYQSPWYENGKYSGIVELSLIIPFEMPHFIRA